MRNNDREGKVSGRKFGRIELDNNTVERSIRPIALNRKNALFAGSDGGGEHWATVASLIETCKLNDIDPLAHPHQQMSGIRAVDVRFNQRLHFLRLNLDFPTNAGDVSL